MNIGSIKAIFVFGEDDDKIAVVSEMIAQIRDDDFVDRILVTGPVSFDKDVTDHIYESLLPQIDQITEILKEKRFNFSLSIRNLSAASISDRGYEIKGFSGDIPIFLSLLSAALQLDMPNDFVSTGHIASPKGDISCVQSIPEKLQAAIVDQIERLFYPDNKCDSSLSKLSPQEKNRIEESVLETMDKIECIPVSNILQVIQHVIKDETIVQAALISDYFRKYSSWIDTKSGSNPLVQYLVKDLEERYETVLVNNLLAGDMDAVRRLLHERIRHEIKQNHYPKDFGRKLFQAINSIPPATRRTKIKFPLVSLHECLQLCQLAKDEEEQDARWLISASAGDRFQQRFKNVDYEDIQTITVDDSAESKLNLVLAEINEEVLAQNIDIPIDQARLTYVMNSIKVQSTEEFYDIITAFYMHLISHIRRISALIQPNDAGAEAYDLLERAYAKYGGVNTAITRATTGIEGGIRRVLDTITDQFKNEEREKHIKRIFKETLDSTDWNAKTVFMIAFLKRIVHQLPPEIQTESPERYAHDYEAIVRLYLKSMETVTERLRIL